LEIFHNECKIKIVGTPQQRPGAAFFLSNRSFHRTHKLGCDRCFGKTSERRFCQPQKGLYSSKAKKSPTPAPPKPQKARKTAKAPQPTPASGEAFSIFTIDLLVEGKESQVDTTGIFRRIREDKYLGFPGEKDN
jgi:hypothetical protein